MRMIPLVISSTDIAAVSMASFNDSRCESGGVDPTDPLLFTCELNEVPILQIVVPTGNYEYVSIGDTTATIHLPSGFIAVSLNMSAVSENTRNISVTLLIVNASLLDGGVIRCDDTWENVVFAGCPLAGEFSTHFSNIHAYFSEHNTVEPLYSGHYWGTTLWPLIEGWPHIRGFCFYTIISF